MKCKAPAADNLSREFSTDATMCCLSSFYVAASSCLMLETGTHREGIWEKGNEHEVGESMSKNSKAIDKSSWSLLTLASSVIFFTHIYICFLLSGAEYTHDQDNWETNDTDLGEEWNTCQQSAALWIELSFKKVWCFSFTSRYFLLGLGRWLCN